MNGWCSNCNEMVDLDSDSRCPNCGEYCCPEGAEWDDEQLERDAVVLWPYGHRFSPGSQQARRKIEDPFYRQR